MNSNDEIILRLNRVEDKVDKIIHILEGSLKQNCEKMGEHINFVENVYENVKHPLNYLCNKVNQISYINGSNDSLNLNQQLDTVTTSEDFSML